jgi:hypothetical protein
MTLLELQMICQAPFKVTGSMLMLGHADVWGDGGGTQLIESCPPVTLNAAEVAAVYAGELVAASV